MLEFAQKVLLSFAKTKPIWFLNIFLSLVGVGAIIWGGVMFYRVVYDLGPDRQQVAFSPALEQVVIDVSGAVTNPGVYSFDQRPRTGDVLEAAGGLDAQADKSFVAHSLNLATILSDGQKLYIPFTGENTSDSNGSAEKKVGLSELVSINHALQSQLEELPGIGEKRALDIIDGRPYETTQELVEKEILSSATYQKIKSLIQI